MKYLVLICLFILLGVIYLSTKKHIEFNNKSSYEYIFESDKDNGLERMSFVEKNTTREKFNKLLDTFISNANRDLFTKVLAFRYIASENKIEYLRQLILIRESMLKPHSDSNWVIQVSKGNFRYYDSSYQSHIFYLDGAIQKLRDVSNYKSPQK
jgi:hypothetical protein